MELYVPTAPPSQSIDASAVIFTGVWPTVIGYMAISEMHVGVTLWRSGTIGECQESGPSWSSRQWAVSVGARAGPFDDGSLAAAWLPPSTRIHVNETAWCSPEIRSPLVADICGNHDDLRGCLHLQP